MVRGRVTLADVARHAGLSVTAASLVLNRRPGTRISQEAQDRVFAAAEELGYRPNVAARSLRTRKTATIAFVSDVVATTRFAGDMIRGALEAARERDHVLLIAETQGDPQAEQQAVEAMLDRQIDGFVYAAMACRRLTVPPAMANRPTVLLNADSTEPVPAILPDDERAGYDVATLLLEHGHRRIAVLGRAGAVERDRRDAARTVRRRLAQELLDLIQTGAAPPEIAARLRVAAPVPLPRTAAEQAQAGTAVDVTTLQPGDLVFFFDGLSHTGVYTGNGMMIHAPGPGAFIREESIAHAGESALRGAIRPA
nr:LacI family DNA-binding transcriptional regulator [Streptomyces sp. ST1020]